VDGKNVMVKTSPTEFQRFLALLPNNLRDSLYLIPIQRHSKTPDVEKDRSWKDPEYCLTIQQALERLETGLNVGIVATGTDLLIIDVDDPEQFRAPKPTLEVETRSGKRHLYYLNGGDVDNRDMPKVAEVRARWRYVLTPGSYVPPDEGSQGAGVYRIVEGRPLTILNAKDLPFQLKSVSTPKLDFRELGGRTWRNQYGWALEAIRKRDLKLDGDDFAFVFYPVGNHVTVKTKLQERKLIGTWQIDAGPGGEFRGEKTPGASEVPGSQ